VVLEVIAGCGAKRVPSGRPVTPAAKAIDGGQEEGKPASELPRP